MSSLKLDSTTHKNYKFCSETIELWCQLHTFVCMSFFIKESTLRVSIFFTKICFNLQFLWNTIKNMITLKSRKQTNCNHLLMCSLIPIVYKNISYGNLVFTEQLFEVVESFWNKLSRNRTCFGTSILFRNNGWIQIKLKNLLTFSSNAWVA